MQLGSWKTKALAKEIQREQEQKAKLREEFLSGAFKPSRKRKKAQPPPPSEEMIAKQLALFEDAKHRHGDAAAVAADAVQERKMNEKAARQRKAARGRRKSLRGFKLKDNKERIRSAKANIDQERRKSLRNSVVLVNVQAVGSHDPVVRERRKSLRISAMPPELQAAEYNKPVVRERRKSLRISAMPLDVQAAEDKKPVVRERRKSLRSAGPVVEAVNGGLESPKQRRTLKTPHPPNRRVSKAAMPDIIEID